MGNTKHMYLDLQSYHNQDNLKIDKSRYIKEKT